MATINGTSGKDSLIGTSGNDTLNGLGDNDTLVGSGGSDFYDGGTGHDTLDLRSTTTATVVNFANGTASGGFSGTFASIERVLAGNGNDTLLGGDGGQNLSARAGNDRLAGGNGKDTLWGGSGADHFVFREFGTANADKVSDFASGSDKIVLDGALMNALGAPGNFAAGDARFVANTTGLAQDADDVIIYETDARKIWYDPDGTGPTPRQLIATLQSGATFAATDILVEGPATPPPPPAPIQGTSGNDSIIGTAGNDTIIGLGGNDWLRGADGNDTLDGGEGSDTLAGGTGSDSLSGGAGNDVLMNTSADFSWYWPVNIWGFAAPSEGDFDILEGGPGDDLYLVRGNVELREARDGGTDTVFAENWTLGDGFERLNVAGVGIGNDLDNVITGSSALGGSNTLDGGGGNDTLVGGAGSAHTFRFAAGSGDIGHDRVDGGGPWVFLDGLEFYAIDSLDYSGARSGVTIDLAAGTGSGGGSGNSGSIIFTNIDYVTGSAFDDRLVAHDGVIYGYGYLGEPVYWDDPSEGYIAGAVMQGGGGNDTLVGGASVDHLVGGAGQDSFVFRHAPVTTNADSIQDFVSGTDKLQLDDAAFSAIGAPGSFAADDARFWSPSSGTAQDASVRVIYDAGNFYYDPDGSGSGEAQLIATFNGQPAIAASDIVVI